MSVHSRLCKISGSNFSKLREVLNANVPPSLSEPVANAYRRVRNMGSQAIPNRTPAANINPTPVNPTPVNPTPVNPTPVNPTPINPSTISDLAKDLAKSQLQANVLLGTGLAAGLGVAGSGALFNRRKDQ